MPGNSNGEKRVVVLLASYNGARFIGEQIGSIAAQSWPRVDIIASDDGSTDGTTEALARLGGAWRKGQFRWRQGPRAGFAENFRTLLADRTLDGEFFAFSDQDDIWAPQKLETAVSRLDALGARPGLFCSRTELISTDGDALGLSPAFRRMPCFGNALVQSLAGGNTMVFNRAAQQLLSEAARRTGFVSHDWFAYQIVAGAGGDVIFEKQPLVQYRQHGSNLVGANRGLRATLERLKAASGGRFVRWNDANCAALDKCRDLLTPEARRQLEIFTRGRKGHIGDRLRMIGEAGLFRQTFSGQMLLYAACILGKV